MNRKIWLPSFDASELPRFPCPRCGEGVLKSSHDISPKQPRWAKMLMERDDAEPDWDKERVAEHIAGYLADLDTADRLEGEAAQAQGPSDLGGSDRRSLIAPPGQGLCGLVLLT